MDMTSAAFNSGSLATNLRWTKPRSHESLHSLEHARKAPDSPVSLKQQLVRPLQEVSRAEQVSRLEVLLLAKSETPTYIPDHETSLSQHVNQAIKACAQWNDIQAVFSAEVEFSPSNLAFGFYRLGCLTALASKKRIADLRASDLVDDVFNRAMLKVDAMDPSSLVLLLDGCARLQHRPSDSDLTRIAWLVHQNVYQMYGRQLPLVVWSFATLHFVPKPEVLFSLEDAVNRQAFELSPQGMALCLSGFRAAKHHLSQSSLQCLADIIQRKLLLFKPSELATCLKALSSQSYKPSPGFFEALAERGGQSLERLFQSNSIASNGEHALMK